MKRSLFRQLWLRLLPLLLPLRLKQLRKRKR